LERGGQLKAQRLALPRRHHGQHVTGGEDRLDHLALTGAEVGEAEHMPELPIRIKRG
jgi:hypothetical protein